MAPGDQQTPSSADNRKKRLTRSCPGVVSASGQVSKKCGKTMFLADYHASCQKCLGSDCDMEPCNVCASWSPGLRELFLARKSTKARKLELSRCERLHLKLPEYLASATPTSIDRKSALRGDGKKPLNPPTHSIALPLSDTCSDVLQNSETPKSHVEIQSCTSAQITGFSAQIPSFSSLQPPPGFPPLQQRFLDPAMLSQQQQTYAAFQNYQPLIPCPVKFLPNQNQYVEAQARGLQLIYQPPPQKRTASPTSQTPTKRHCTEELLTGLQTSFLLDAYTNQVMSQVSTLATQEQAAPLFTTALPPAPVLIEQRASQPPLTTTGDAEYAMTAGVDKGDQRLPTTTDRGSLCKPATDKHAAGNQAPRRDPPALQTKPRAVTTDRQGGGPSTSSDCTTDSASKGGGTHDRFADMRADSETLAKIVRASMATDQGESLCFKTAEAYDLDVTDAKTALALKASCYVMESGIDYIHTLIKDVDFEQVTPQLPPTKIHPRSFVSYDGNLYLPAYDDDDNKIYLPINTNLDCILPQPDECLEMDDNQVIIMEKIPTTTNSATDTTDLSPILPATTVSASATTDSTKYDHPPSPAKVHRHRHSSPRSRSRRHRHRSSSSSSAHSIDRRSSTTDHLSTYYKYSDLDGVYESDLPRYVKQLESVHFYLPTTRPPADAIHSPSGRDRRNLVQRSSHRDIDKAEFRLPASVFTIGLDADYVKLVKGKKDRQGKLDKPLHKDQFLPETRFSGLYQWFDETKATLPQVLPSNWYAIVGLKDASMKSAFNFTDKQLSDMEILIRRSVNTASFLEHHLATIHAVLRQDNIDWTIIRRLILSAGTATAQIQRDSTQAVADITLRRRDVAIARLPSNVLDDHKTSLRSSSFRGPDLFDKKVVDVVCKSIQDDSNRQAQLNMMNLRPGSTYSVSSSSRGKTDVNRGSLKKSSSSRSDPRHQPRNEYRSQPRPRGRGGQQQGSYRSQSSNKTRDPPPPKYTEKPPPPPYYQSASKRGGRGGRGR